jgi:hypothetical protein
VHVWTARVVQGRDDDMTDPSGADMLCVAARMTASNPAILAFPCAVTMPRAAP